MTTMNTMATNMSTGTGTAGTILPLTGADQFTVVRADFLSFAFFFLSICGGDVGVGG